MAIVRFLCKSFLAVMFFCFGIGVADGDGMKPGDSAMKMVFVTTVAMLFASAGWRIGIGITGGAAKTPVEKGKVDGGFQGSTRRDQPTAQTEPRAVNAYPDFPEAVSVNSPPDSPLQTDVNSASEEDLALLPYMNQARISSILALRQRRQSFASVEDLGRVCSLKPHQIENLRPYVIFGTASSSSPLDMTGPRVVDF